MATNEILQFAETDTGTNLLTQAEYLADPQRPIGNQPGVARSKLVNKALRQASLISAGVAEFLAEAQANNITDSLTPQNIADYMAAAVRSLGIPTTVAGGTADAITADFVPDITLTNGTTVIVRAGFANITTTPTFAPDSMTAKTIVKGSNLALVAGDIAGAGHWIELQYDSTLNKWVLLNPATGVTAAQVKQIQSITASVAANALTLGLNPTSLDFRNSSLTNGVPNTRTVSTAISLVVPSGATLGTTSGQAARLVLLAIDNGGTVELAVVNLAGGNNLDETSLISTTAISASANSANVIYSTTARTNVPFRVIGFVESTQATAGTWATAPTLVQGYGGQAMAAMQSLGFGQTNQNVTASRASGVTYYNTTGRPILVTISSTASPTQSTVFAVNGQNVCSVTADQVSQTLICGGIVPPGASYSATLRGSLAIWNELR